MKPEQVADKILDIGKFDKNSPVFDIIKAMTTISDELIRDVDKQSLIAHAERALASNTDRQLVLRVSTMEEAIREDFRVAACGFALRKLIGKEIVK